MSSSTFSKVCYLFVMIMSLSCTPEAQDLPPMTHEGRNTIGYYLEDGTLIGGVLDSKDSLIEFPNGDVRIVHKYFYLKHMWQTEVIYLLTLDFKKDSIDNKLYFANATYDEYMYDLGTLDAEKPNFLSIEYQSAGKKIISGTFELNFHNVDTIFYDEDSIDFIRVNYAQTLSRGRFDFDYSK